MRYQLVIPDGMKLNDLIFDAAVAASAAAAHARHLPPPGASEAGPVGKAIQHALERHLEEFDVCGHERVCFDAMVPESSAAHTSIPSEQAAREAMHVFHVDAPQGRLLLEIELAKAACRALPPNPGGDTVYSLEPRVAAAIGHVLDPHLFKGLLCGSERCARISEPVRAARG